MFPTANGIERYELQRELSTNDGGATYKAIVRGTQRTIAVRCIKPHSTNSLDINAILQHANSARTLNSPYIVHLLEAYEIEGIAYLAMDYAEGALLASALGTAKISDWELADVSRQICSAIDHAASLNVCHQNLNPRNVIQEWDGTVKLLDYGVTANPVRRAQDNPGALAALRYVSPEQACGKPLDRRSNLYSWGAILYEMATGKSAFEGDTAAAILEQIANVIPAAPHRIKGGVPHGLSRIIMKALAKSPGERYQSGAELLHDLDHYADQVTVAPKKIAVATPPRLTVAAPTPETPQEPPEPQPARTEAPIVPPARVPAPMAIPTRTPAAHRPTVEAPVSPRPPEPPPRAPQTRSVPTTTSHLEPTPRSEFIIVGPKKGNPEPTPEALPQKPAAQEAAPTPPKAQKPVGSSKKLSNKALLLILSGAAVLFVLVLALCVTGIVLSLRREKPALQALNAPDQTAPVEQPIITEAQAPQPAAPVEPTTTKKKKQAATSAPVAAAPKLGNLLISSTPEGALIEIDGQGNQFPTPHTTPGLAAGSHTIRVSKAGYETVTRVVDVPAGQTATLNLQLVELRATLVINSDPNGALVSINGEKSNRTTPVTVMLLKGRYTITLSKQGFLPAESSIDVSPGQSYRVAPHLAPLGNADAIKDVNKLQKLFGGGHGSQMGKVQFRTMPKGAQVSVNGKIMKKQTPMELMFPGGPYEIVITLPGYKTVQKTITVTENGTQAVDVQLERETK